MALPLVLAAGVYAGTLANGLVFDDVHQVLNNSWIRDFSHLREIFSTHVWAFAGRESNYYRPLMHVTYAVIYALAGVEAWAFHLVNVLLHVLMTYGVFLLTERILRGPSLRGPGSPPWIPASAASLFAVHPIHTEAVAWVACLPDLGAATLFIAALLAYLEALRSALHAHRWHAAGAAAFLAGMLFKEPAVTLPGVVLAVDLVVRPSRNRTFWGTRYGWLGLAAAAYLVARVAAVSGLVPHASESTFGVLDALNMAGAALWRYLAWMILPLEMNVFHTAETATAVPSWLAVLAPLLAAVAVWKRSLPASVGGAILLCSLVPALYAPALLPGLDNPWAERYAYLPSAGLAVLVAWLIHVAWTRDQRAGLALASMLALLLVPAAWGTVERSRVWKNDLSLWTDAAAKSPDSGAVRGYLGYALLQAGRAEEALPELETAVRLEPAFPQMAMNLGVARAALGLHVDAIEAYQASIRLDPRLAQAHANLALSLVALGRADLALVSAQEAVGLRPELALSQQALGVALGNLGRYGEAAAAFERAVALDPDDRFSRENLNTARQLAGSGS